MQIAVERDDRVTGGMMDTGLHGGSLSILATEANDLHTLVGRRKLLETVAAAIGRAVIDKDDFPRAIEARQHSRKLVIEGRDIFQLVADGDDYGNGHGRPASKRAKCRAEFTRASRRGEWQFDGQFM